MMYFDLLKSSYIDADDVILKEENNGENNASIIISIAHAGLLVPHSLEDYLFIEDRALLKSTDMFTDKLFECGKGAEDAGEKTIIKTRINKYVVNLNRGRENRSRDGVFGMAAWNNAQATKRELNEEEKKWLLKRYYDVYHGFLRKAVHAMKKRNGYALVLDVHSYTKEDSRWVLDSGNEKKDFCIGTLDGRSCSSGLAALLTEILRKKGYTVSMNYPYKGGSIARCYSSPKNNVHVIQLEINKRNYLDEENFAVNDNFNKLKKDLHECVRELHECIMELIRS